MLKCDIHYDQARQKRSLLRSTQTQPKLDTHIADKNHLDEGRLLEHMTHLYGRKRCGPSEENTKTVSPEKK